MPNLVVVGPGPDSKGIKKAGLTAIPPLIAANPDLYRSNLTSRLITVC